MQFEPAKVEDAAAISALIRVLSRSFMLAPDGSGAEEFLAAVSETAEAGYIASERYQFIVARAEGMGDDIAGFVAMRDASHLYHLFVAETFQGKGVARSLWMRALSQARAGGYAGPFTVNAAPAAVPMYAHFGFVVTGEMVRAYGIAFVPMALPERAVPIPS